MIVLINAGDQRREVAPTNSDSSEIVILDRLRMSDDLNDVMC